MGWKYDAPSEVEGLLEFERSHIEVLGHAGGRCHRASRAVSEQSEHERAVQAGGERRGRDQPCVGAVEPRRARPRAQAGRRPQRPRSPQSRRPTRRTSMCTRPARRPRPPCRGAPGSGTVPPMLLSRLTRSQPSGVVIVPLPDRRAVTAATMTSPETATGRAIVSEDAFEARAVVRPRKAIEPTDESGDEVTSDGSRSGRLFAGGANAPASAAAPSRAVQAAIAIPRGRLPNIASASAVAGPCIRFSPFLCTSVA